MAKNTLPTNYQDDILNASMNGKRRYNLIQNTDGTVSLEDVTDYDQVGSNFGAGQINAITTAVNESADKNRIIDSLSTIKTNMQSGYMAGALAAKELYNEINGNFAFSAYKVTANSSYISGSTFGGLKLGKICMIQGFAIVSKQLSENTEIFRVDAKYAPNSKRTFLLTPRFGVDNLQLCSFGTDGIAKTWENAPMMTSGEWILASPLVYISK